MQSIACWLPSVNVRNRLSIVDISLHQKCEKHCTIATVFIHVDLSACRLYVPADFLLNATWLPAPGATLNVTSAGLVPLVITNE